jgi:hypothetical protein
MKKVKPVEKARRMEEDEVTLMLRVKTGRIRRMMVQSFVDQGEFLKLLILSFAADVLFDVDASRFLASTSWLTRISTLGSSK